MTSLLIADGHAVTRAGYRQFVSGDRAITLVGEASSEAEARQRLSLEEWDLLLLDLQLIKANGLDFLRDMRTQHTTLRILVVSGLPEESYAREVLQAGAGGYLSKTSAPAELAKAIGMILANRRYVSPTVAEMLAKDFGTDQDSPIHQRLSTREFQIFCMLAGGAGITAISKELALSVKTVSTYRARILQKTGLNSNAHMTSYALRNGLID